MTNLDMKSQGFTLIEIVAGLSILSLAILTLMPLMIQASDWTKQSEDYMAAGHLVPAIIHDIESDKDNVQTVLSNNISDARTVLDAETLANLGILQDYNYRIELVSIKDSVIDAHKLHISVLRDNANDAESPKDIVLADGYAFVRLGGGSE